MADEGSIQSSESSHDSNPPNHAAAVVPESKAKAKPTPKPKHELQLIPLGIGHDKFAEQVQDDRILVVVGHGSCEERAEQIQVRQGCILSYTRVGQVIYHTQAKTILSRLDDGVILSKVGHVREGLELELQLATGEYCDYAISFGDDKLKEALQRNLGYYVYDPEEHANKLIGFQDWRHYSPMLSPPQGDFVRMSDVLRFKDRLEGDSKIQHVLFLACKEIKSEPKLTDQCIKTRCDFKTCSSHLDFEVEHASEHWSIDSIFNHSKARLVHIEGVHDNSVRHHHLGDRSRVRADQNLSRFIDAAQRCCVTRRYPISGYKLAAAIIGRLKVDQEHRCEGCFINARVPEDELESITQLCERHLRKDRPFQIACWQGDVTKELRRRFFELLYMAYEANVTLSQAIETASSVMIDDKLPLFVTSTRGKVSIPSPLDDEKDRLINVTLEIARKESELDTWNNFIENVMDSSFWSNYLSCDSQVAWVDVVVKTRPEIRKPRCVKANIDYFEAQLQQQLGVNDVRFSGFGSLILRMYVSSLVELRNRCEMGTVKISTPAEWGASEVIVTDISLGTRFWAQFLISREDNRKINLEETFRHHLLEPWHIDVDAAHEDSKWQQTHPEEVTVSLVSGKQVMLMSHPEDTIADLRKALQQQINATNKSVKIVRMFGASVLSEKERRAEHGNEFKAVVQDLEDDFHDILQDSRSEVTFGEYLNQLSSVSALKYLPEAGRYLASYLFTDRKQMHSASVSFNYFTNGAFTFKAWKEIPLHDIRISRGEAHSYRWQVSKEQPFLKLQLRENPLHMRISKALGLQISELFSFHWTEHITGGLPYIFATIIIGLIFEEDPRPGGGSPILQWRVFVITKDDLNQVKGDGIFFEEELPTLAQKRDRWEKIKLMKNIYDHDNLSFVEISVPKTRKTVQ